MVWAVSLLTTELIHRGLTARLWVGGIRSLVGVGKIFSHRIHPEPYLHQLTPDAVPQYISGRTSYLLVRLAFHPYPQLISQFCNTDQFGPPLRFYRSFTLAMGGSPGFGSNPCDLTPYSDSLSLRLRHLSDLTLPQRLTRRIILQ